MRHIFQRYLAAGSVRDLMVDLDRAGIRTKPQQMRDGSVRGDLPFTRGPLYHLLKNRIYLGDITHHEKVHPGEHEAIIDRTLFEQVQALLAANAADRRDGKRATNPSLLTGMMRDAQDRPLSPVHATKGRIRYRYYVTNLDVAGDGDAPSDPLRLAAPEVEHAVRHAMAQTLERAAWLENVLPWMSADEGRRALAASAQLAKEIEDSPASRCRELLLRLDLQILVDGAEVFASCSGEAIAARIGMTDSLEISGRVPIAFDAPPSREGKACEAHH